MRSDDPAILATIVATYLRNAGDRESPATLRVGALLVTLLCLCVMLCGTITSPALAARQSRSVCFAQHGRVRTAVLAHTSDSEAEKPEEELQEGEEEAATAEVEAEEAEGGEDISPTTGSDGADSGTISDLKLTARATAALAHRLPSASAIAFSFTLSARSSVHVTIVRQTASGHEHWSMLPDSLTLSVARGPAARSLRGHNRLSPGRYRLTLKPTGGHSRSIYLSVQP
ncbi:MAG TPA: hypothetical protein VHY18_13920 [Solirubrobacteraceae bacterium]|nr:hypothetical protein [Solirubrobacteraceae bacterium]